MPSYYLLFPLLLLPALLLFFLFPKGKSIFPKQNHIRRPPGPWTLPVLGSIHHFIGRGLPHQALRSLSQHYGHLVFLQIGELPIVVASSREAAREIMKTHDLKFCSRPINSTTKILTRDRKDLAFAPYGEYWRAIRKICVLDLFSSKRVQSFRSIREEEVKNLIQRISSLSSARQSLNLSERLLILANDVTIRAMMGGKSKDQDLFMREIENVVVLGAGFNLIDMFPSSRLASMLSGAVSRAEEFCRTVDQLFDNIIRERREKEGDGDAKDLLTVLLRLHDEDSEKNMLSMDSIKGIIFDIIAGGTQTTGTTLDWAMAELMKNPRVMTKVQTELRKQLQGLKSITESDLAELNFLRLVIKETLRLHPPVPLLLPRECRETCNILGYDIPKGTIVAVNAWAIGRDSNYWIDADEFKPERFEEVDSDVYSNGENFAFIPFGIGRRMCPGLLFGSATLELALANLLYHFDWELPCGMYPDEVDMTETFGSTISRKSPLCLLALPYHNVRSYIPAN